jgi:hypothetical protein
MTRYKAIFPWLLFAAASSVMAEQGHYAISPAQIAATVNRYGIGIAPDQVRLLTGVVATTNAPRLTVRSIQPWGNERMMARLECENREQCLPFLVGLEMGPANGSQMGPKSSTPSGNAATNEAASPKAYLLRKGAPATLQLDSERVHIRISVICLENGAPGQTIRVTGIDHRLVYTARVMDGGLLLGRL